VLAVDITSKIRSIKMARRRGKGNPIDWDCQVWEIHAMAHHHPKKRTDSIFKQNSRLSVHHTRAPDWI